MATKERHEYLPRREAHREGTGEFARGNIPPAVRIPRQSATYLFSSMISGHDDESPAHEVPDDPEREAEIMFRHVRQFVEAAGGKPRDILSMTVFVMDDSYRDLMAKHIGQLFPEASERPGIQFLNVAPKGLINECFEVVVTACIPH